MACVVASSTDSSSRIATVMMHIVDERHAFGLADRQQIGWRVNLVVVLDGQACSGSL